MRIPLAAVLAHALLSGLLVAQSNTIDGLDVKMKEITDLTQVGREGGYPTGMNGLSFETTCCNPGTVDVPWLAAMERNHPVIAFMVVRETGGQFFQISDASYLKHGFASINANGCAGNCVSTNSRELGVNCSDTYSVGNNSDRYWLGPPEEIDPWLGDWEPVCSHFDRGEPSVSPPFDCDGIRSLSDSMISRMGPVTHRIEVSDADLDVPGSRYFFYGTYVVRGEAEEERFNNSMTREFFPTWNGNRWEFALAPFSENKRGSVLRMWEGAAMSSASNGEDDGRVYVASSVSGPDGAGFYRYEYAIHNRDSLRGTGALEIPLRKDATVQNIGFHDVDAVLSNEWTATVRPGAIRFESGTGPDANPVRWNTVYNLWFECDVAPVNQMTGVLEPFEAGAGADVLSIKLRAPMGPQHGTNLGYAKAGGSGIEPRFVISGSFAAGDEADLQIHHAEPDSRMIFVVSDQSNPTPFNGGTLVPLPIIFLRFLRADSTGYWADTAPGLGSGGPPLYAQFVIFDPTATKGTSLSNAVEFTLD